MTQGEPGAHEVKSSMHAAQGLSPEEWHANLVKDGGRRVMYGGNAYEDDLEPAAGPAESGQEQPAPTGATPSCCE
jgi:hypothetical protein